MNARTLIENDDLKDEMMDEPVMSIEALMTRCRRAGLRVKLTETELRISNPATGHWIGLDLEEDPESLEATALELCHDFEQEWQRQVGQHIE